MVRKTLLSLSLILIVFLISCTSPKEQSPEEMWFWAETDNALRDEVFRAWTNYVDIIDHTIKAKSPEDYSYIAGRIDTQLRWTDQVMQRVFTLSNISKRDVDTFIARDLQQPLYQLIGNMSNHLNQIKSFIDEEKSNDIHSHDEQMQEIIKAVKGLNGGSSNYLFDPEESIETLQTVQHSNRLIEELLIVMQ